MADRKPSDEEVQRLYDQLFADGHYEFHRQEFEELRSGTVPRRIFRERLLRQAQRQTSGRRLTEIGGGTGVFGAIATRQGWDYVDYDVSDEAVRRQQELGHQAVLFHPSESAPVPEGSADVVAMFEVLEHIWDLHEHLAVIRQALSPGGAFIFSTPNFDRPEYQQAIRDRAPLSSPPIHLNFFVKDSLREVLGRQGLRAQFSSNRIRRPQKGIHFLRTAVGLYPPSTIYGIAIRK